MEKEMLLLLINSSENCNLRKLLSGKVYNSSLLKSMILNNEFIICGGGIIDRKILEEVIDKKNLQLLKENLISVQSDEEFNHAKIVIHSYYEHQQKEQKENDNILEDKILETIKQFIPDPDNQIKVLEILKVSKGLTGEKAFLQADKVYPFISKRDDLLKIFSTIEINLKNYNVKERKENGKIII